MQTRARFAALTLTGVAAALVGGGLGIAPIAAHAAATAALPAGTCQDDTAPNCSTYEVPTSVKDAYGNPVDIFLEVRHATDAQGHNVAAPLILTYSPYSDIGRNGDAAHWNALGYSRAYADVVGTGNSGGCWDYGGPKEQQTGYDVVEAIAAQPWSNGKIGMLGASYDGTTQYAIAIHHPPHLVTIVPEAAIDRWYDYAFANGIRYFYTTEPFGYEGPGTAGDEGIDTPAGFDFGLAIPPPIDEQDPNWANKVKSHIAVCQQVEHTMYGYSQTPDYNQFWLNRDYLHLLSTVTIPVLVASNWGDWNVKQVDGWQAFHALKHSVFARLYFGSRWHGHGVPPGNDYNTTLDKWFAHWLQGAHNGLQTSLPQVTSQTTDSNGPSDDHYLSGPEPHPPHIPLYLVHYNDGTWGLSPDKQNAPSGSPQATIQWTGTNTETNEVLHPFFPDNRYIAFTSPVLTRDIRIYGEPSLHLWSTIQRSWITYTPRLLDFDPSKYTGSGAATTATTNTAIPAMTRGWMDSRYRHGLSSEVQVTPGSAFLENIPLWPQDYTVRAGHRLVLILSTETTDWDVPKFATSLDTGSATARIDYEQSQSYITLPIVGVTSGDELFGSTPPTQVPEAPAVSLFAAISVAAAALLIKVRRRIAVRMH